MTHEEVQRWLDHYIAAWASNDPGTIGDLFSEDAAYSYRPWESDTDTVRGRDAIVASWLESPDDPSTWEAEYRPYAVEGGQAVAVGSSRYHATDDEPERTYHNAFLLEFDDDGRCSSFREFWFRQKT
ncbi:MAG TPA: nuclear transport factor 2 family protein [Acidimicrobiia bacterium]|nr:nuclear transport factor 2 family protein [Acidimicrobiia bacterium]